MPTADSESTALLTDRYELTMLEAALASGVADHRAVFEVFARSLPGGRRFGVLAGTARAIDAIQSFRFADDDVRWLVGEGIVSATTGEWLSKYRFSGSVRGYPEGEVYFPGSPVLTVAATFAEAVLLETVVLSILNDDSAVATAAARTVAAARGRRLIEMGSRRTNEHKAASAARAAYIAGFDATSNLMAGRLYGVPTTGTAAHAFTLAHKTEAEAFAAQVATHGPGTTLLVDTYDVHTGVDAAVEAAGPSLGAIRIDSGDLLSESAWARRRLDSLGATETKIVVSGNLDEHVIDRLTNFDQAGAISGFGVGENVVSGANCPQAGFVYKLVAIADDKGFTSPLRPVAKRSRGKASVGGRKLAYRSYSGHPARATAELVIADGSNVLASDEFGWVIPLQTMYLVGGFSVRPPEEMTAECARRHCAKAVAELPDRALDLSPGEPAIPTKGATVEAQVAAA